jgi:hypothetical protein
MEINLGGELVGLGGEAWGWRGDVLRGIMTA